MCGRPWTYYVRAECMHAHEQLACRRRCFSVRPAYASRRHNGKAVWAELCWYRTVPRQSCNSQLISACCASFTAHELNWTELQFANSAVWTVPCSWTAPLKLRPCGAIPVCLLLLLLFWPRYSILREWKKYAMQYKKYINQAGMNLTPPPPSQNSHAVRWL